MSNGKAKDPAGKKIKWSTSKHSEESQKKMIADARKKGLFEKWKKIEEEEKEGDKPSISERVKKEAKKLKKKYDDWKKKPKSPYPYPTGGEFNKGGKTKGSSHSRGFSQHD